MPCWASGWWSCPAWEESGASCCEEDHPGNTTVLPKHSEKTPPSDCTSPSERGCTSPAATTEESQNEMYSPQKENYSRHFSHWIQNINHYSGFPTSDPFHHIKTDNHSVKTKTSCNITLAVTCSLLGSRHWVEIQAKRASFNLSSHGVWGLFSFRWIPE